MSLCAVRGELQIGSGGVEVSLTDLLVCSSPLAIQHTHSPWVGCQEWQIAAHTLSRAPAYQLGSLSLAASNTDCHSSVSFNSCSSNIFRLYIIEKMQKLEQISQKMMNIFCLMQYLFYFLLISFPLISLILILILLISQEESLRLFHLITLF